MFTNTMGCVGVWMTSCIWANAPVMGAGYAFFAFNYSYKSWNLVSHAVTRVDLLPGGKRARFTLGRLQAREVEINIRDIEKQVHERTLVETFEEASMFPLKVGETTYYLNGQGQEAVIEGELLRAVINGQSIQFHAEE